MSIGRLVEASGAGTKVKISAFFERVFSILRFVVFIIFSIGILMPRYSTTIIVAYSVLILASLLMLAIHRLFLGKYDYLKLKIFTPIITIKNQKIIRFIRKVSFYGLLERIFCIVVFRVNLHMEGVKIASFYSAFLEWSLIMFIISFALLIGIFIFYYPHAGEGAYSIPHIVWQDIKISFSDTFRFVPKKDQDGKVSAGTIVVFVLGRLVFLLFIIFSIIGIISVR